MTIHQLRVLPFVLGLSVALGATYSRRPRQADSIPAGFIRELASYQLPAYPGELRGQAIPVDVSLTIRVDAAGRVDVLRREDVTPRVPSDVVSAAAAALLFAEAARAVASWRYAPGPIATKYRLVFGMEAPNGPREDRPVRLLYVEPVVPRALLPKERRVLVQGHLDTGGVLKGLHVEGAGGWEPVVLSVARQWRFGGTLRPSLFSTLAAIRPED